MSEVLSSMQGMEQVGETFVFKSSVSAAQEKELNALADAIAGSLS
jgi:hypothetical protein